MDRHTQKSLLKSFFQIATGIALFPVSYTASILFIIAAVVGIWEEFDN